MHENSIKTYYEGLRELTKRQAHIYEILQQRSHEVFTDREIKDILNFSDMNAVRPRITEMIKQGLVKESGVTKCKVTNKTVRLIRCITGKEYENNQKKQGTLNL